MSDLHALLHSTFGHTNFRANQEAVCHAATSGKDVLLVMPTGAGKSLCYQLPALARGGTALVISPLIALMDDQAAKLSSHGLKVARIHSGLSRDETRQACRDYLDGSLNFLFIAPERMRVPNFPEMLARRKPSLIAIDEAHCISAWGHDFRPDYRTLGEHLPALRPSPIIALTATATPTVQRDIVAQLQLGDPALFIHGFRRDNLAIEVVEMSKPRRHQFAATLLADPASRPAIVYAPSRKAAEELAAELNTAIKSGSTKKIAAAYHAGLEPSTRERVQSAFQSGSLEVVVATIAFGMGIDKADVRTVIHTALPGSVEAFYQEIGRAGRDGLPSRTVLLHSYADRKMHEFFLERDYPPATDLARVASVLTDEDLMPEPLARRLKMDLDTFNKAVLKLIGQNAATVDMAGNVRRLGDVTQAGSWRTGYESQIAFRRAQLDRMAAFADTQQCRMTALIRHFGDTADAHRPCGHCDFCSPHTTSAQTFAPPTTEQSRHLRSILRTLDARSTSTGKLHTDLALREASGRALDRRTFDVLLDALARAGFLTLTSETFTSKEDDREITYKKAALTHEGRQDNAHDLTGVLLPTTPESPNSAAKSRKPSGSRPSKASLKLEREQTTAAYTPAQRDLEDRLRVWRKAEAAKTGKPAFMVFSDAVMHSIVRTAPTTLPALLEISGIGPRIADIHGADIIALCREQHHIPILSPSAPAPITKTDRTTKGPTARPIPAHGKVLGAPANNPSSPAGAPYTPPAETFHRTRPTQPDPTESLTPDQLLLDEKLRTWRKSESERLGLPQFFLLSSSTLRAIVLLRPTTTAQLQTIPGIGPDKIEKFGPDILALCNA
ncbi:MAG TPA: RecQ family ATP-dependent DNA helicase [Acidobacteriaceae bacterium]|nr:RecQ family ATP-dependent DNA helicase [Acidobacteriaceae bacterium]